MKVCKVLGVDTSSTQVAVGLIDSDHVVFDHYVDFGQFYSEKLIIAIHRLREDAGVKIKEVDLFAVGLGPGAFTGLRIGVATVKGLAFALDKPIVGIGSLDGLAMEVKLAKYPIVPVVDGKRGDVFYAIYQDGERVTGYEVDKVGEFLDRVKSGEYIFVGDGADIYREQLIKLMNKRAHFITPNPIAPRGATIAWLGKLKCERGELDDIKKLEPLYLHPPLAHIKDR